VSVFTRWGPKVEQVWVKSRAGKEPEDVLPDLFGAVPATVDRHPVLGLDPVNSTPQLGRPGPWSDRLPHFRIGYRPGTGDELQSEYLVARRDGLTAIERVRAVANRIQPLLRVAEIRTWPPAASG
jgi:xylitol oxidase